METNYKLRSLYQPKLPPCLQFKQGTAIRLELDDATTPVEFSLDEPRIKKSFPHTYGQPLAHLLRIPTEDFDASQHPAIRVGVLFCGGESPGGYNVIWGLHDALKVHNPSSTLLGFLGSSNGLSTKDTRVITDDILAAYKNQGGYELLGPAVDRIATIRQVDAAMLACRTLELHGLVIIGGVTANSDAVHLAEKFAEAKCSTKVVGIPVTANGDIKNQFVEANVGFDTICKINSLFISNICTEALSAEKDYYFIRLMGSHVALECALQSIPNMVILGEVVAASRQTLFDIRQEICDAVQDRADNGENHGVILLHDGLIQNIPEVHALLQEINRISDNDIPSELSQWGFALLNSLPEFIREQLLIHPESDDYTQLSQIDTVRLIAELVQTEMEKRSKQEGPYSGKKFNATWDLSGYEAKNQSPSKFDCDYAFALGHICYHILVADLNGYMATITNLKSQVNDWCCGAAPISAMTSVEHYGRDTGTSLVGVPLLRPAIVDLEGKAYKFCSQIMEGALLKDIYRKPDLLLFRGPGADARTITLCLEDRDRMECMKKFRECIDQLFKFVKPRCSENVLDTRIVDMLSATNSVLALPAITSNDIISDIYREKPAKQPLPRKAKKSVKRKEPMKESEAQKAKEPNKRKKLTKPWKAKGTKSRSGRYSDVPEPAERNIIEERKAKEPNKRKEPMKEPEAQKAKEPNKSRKLTKQPTGTKSRSGGYHDQLQPTERNVTQGDKKRAEEVALAATTETSFLVVMSPTHVYRNFRVKIPAAARSFFPRKSIYVILRDGEKRWQVYLNHSRKARKKDIMLSTGWRNFVKDNSLQESDVCVFYVGHENEDIILDVSIFKVTPTIERNSIENEQVAS